MPGDAGNIFKDMTQARPCRDYMMKIQSVGEAPEELKRAPPNAGQACRQRKFIPGDTGRRTAQSVRAACSKPLFRIGIRGSPDKGSGSSPFRLGPQAKAPLRSVCSQGRSRSIRPMWP